MPRREQNFSIMEFFRGLYSRQLINVGGSSTDRYQVPPGYGHIWVNTAWADQSITHRPGSQFSWPWDFAPFPVVRAHKFRLDDDERRYLLLDEDGNIFDTGYKSSAVIHWNNVVGVTIASNTITKTAGDGDGNAGASSAPFLYSGDGYVETTVVETNKRRIIGLSKGDTDQTFADVDFGLQMTVTGDLYQYEGGTLLSFFGTYALNDVLKVAVEDGIVKYYKNGVLLLASLKEPTYPLLVDTALYTNGATLSNINVSPGFITPILTIAGMEDFSMQIIADRAYITPHNRDIGKASQYVYVWDPALMIEARKAAGAKPTGTFTVAVSTTNGNVEPGQHVLAVAFETNTGFITKPALYVLITAPSGTKKCIDLTAIPTGPTGTVARHILMSWRLFNYDGNMEHPELFFALRIADNTTTSLTGTSAINKYDTELLDSADYLKDNLEEIPAGVTIGMYQGRMTIGGCQEVEVGTTKKTKIKPFRVSLPGDFETFSAVDGFLNIPDIGGNVKNQLELKGVFYIFKSNMTLGTQDDGNSPNRWQVAIVESGIGTECFGITSLPVTDGGQTRGQQTIILHRSGVYTFDGSYGERSLTWVCYGAWKRLVASEDMTKFQIVRDPHRNLIYILTRSVSGGDAILYGDFDNGLNWDAIRWSTWNYYRRVNCMLVDIHELTKTPTLYLGSEEGMHEFPDQEANIPYLHADKDSSAELHDITLDVWLAPVGFVEDYGDSTMEGVKIIGSTKEIEDAALLDVEFIPLDEISGTLTRQIVFTGNNPTVVLAKLPDVVIGDRFNVRLFSRTQTDADRSGAIILHKVVVYGRPDAQERP